MKKKKKKVFFPRPSASEGDRMRQVNANIVRQLHEGTNGVTYECSQPPISVIVQETFVNLPGLTLQEEDARRPAPPIPTLGRAPGQTRPRHLNKGSMGFLGAYERWCNCSLPGTSDPLTHLDPLLANLNPRYTNRAKLKGWLAGCCPGRHHIQRAIKYCKNISEIRQTLNCFFLPKQSSS